MTDIERIFEKVKKKNSPIIFSETLNEITKFYLLISHILENFGKGLSLTRVRGILLMSGFPENDIMDAENRLKDSGLIGLRKGKYLYCLHNGASELCKRLLDVENRKELISSVVKIAEEIEYSGPRGKIDHNKIAKIGYDMAIYVDHGEADRILGCIKNYKLDFNLGGYNRRRQTYIIHAPTIRKTFLNKVRDEIMPLSRHEPRIIEIESWNVKKFNEALNPMINAPRKQLDILFSAMPRIAVISFFLQLNLNEIKCKQKWIYNEAYRYNYGKGKVGESFIAKGSVNNNNSLVTFGENYPVRFEEMESGFKEYDINRIGFGNLSDMNKEYPINMKSYKTMKELEIPNREFFTADYLSAVDVCNRLNYYQPGTIYVGGNRVVALGTALYYLKCLTNPQTLEIPTIISEHVIADNYSEGFSGPNITVLEI